MDLQTRLIQGRGGFGAPGGTHGHCPSNRTPVHRSRTNFRRRNAPYHDKTPMERGKKVVVKLMAPIFLDRFIYACFQNAVSDPTHSMTPSLMMMLGVLQHTKQKPVLCTPLKLLEHLSDEQRKILQHILHSNNHLQLVTAPAGSGKTVLMATLLRLRNMRQRCQNEERRMT